MRYDGPVGVITACHCGQCRKTSGHFAASFDAEADRLDWQGLGATRSHSTPGGGRRTFCATCGSRLWFQASDGAIAVEAGLIDGPSHGILGRHIFVADKGDYYDISDGLPQSEQSE